MSAAIGPAASRPAAVVVFGKQYLCHGGANQDWRIVNVGRGYYQLMNRNSQLCLDVAGGSARPIGEVDEERVVKKIEICR